MTGHKMRRQLGQLDVVGVLFGPALCFMLVIIEASSPLHHALETKYPCAFIDTINITDSVSLNDMGAVTANGVGNYESSNKDSSLKAQSPSSSSSSSPSPAPSQSHNNLTYIHNWMDAHRELVAIYDFVIENGVRVPAPSHYRACVCKLNKACIRFCCAQGYYYDVTNHTCTGASIDAINATLDEMSMLVHTKNGSLHRINTAEQFNIYIGTPCQRMRTVFKDPKELVNWSLYENGTIAYKQHLFSKHYCYSPYQVQNKTWIWQPLACSTEKIAYVLGVREWTYVVCLILATICMAIILIIHLMCTEIRNTFYGVAIKAYSLCTIIAYSLMIHLQLTDPTKMSRISCVFIPCSILMCLLLSFYVLTFISFNFYLNFHGVVLTHVMFWLIFFPIVSLAVGWSLFASNSSYDGKAVFGGETCWFDPRNWAIMVYFYAPVFVACVVSIFFYILTQIKILERQEGETKALSVINEENRYSSFCKFLCYTFLKWLICVISFIINYNRGERTHINYVVCLVVALHGFGSLYALVGKNHQIQNFLRRIEEDIDDEDEEIGESAVPMRPLNMNNVKSFHHTY